MVSGHLELQAPYKFLRLITAVRRSRHSANVRASECYSRTFSCKIGNMISREVIIWECSDNIKL